MTNTEGMTKPECRKNVGTTLWSLTHSGFIRH
jgi:hypothetical protein